MSTLVTLNASSILGSVSCGLNFVAAVILIGALLPPFIETVKSKKTYALGDKFFLYYTLGGVFMLINAIVNVSVMSDASLIAMFAIMIIVNLFSITLNSYILKVKRKNMKESALRGMSEQDYYEKVLKLEIQE